MSIWASWDNVGWWQGLWAGPLVEHSEHQGVRQRMAKAEKVPGKSEEVPLTTTIIHMGYKCFGSRFCLWSSGSNIIYRKIFLRIEVSKISSK